MEHIFCLDIYTEGDCIYQVFAYDKSVYNEIMEQYPQTDEYLFGLRVANFRLFTKPRNSITNPDLTFGYSEYVGKILALSQDPSFENIRPFLKDNLYDVQESIFKFVTDFNVISMTNSMTSTIKLKLKFDTISSYTITDSTLQHYWSDTLMASTFQKFGRDSSPNFENVSAESFSSYMQTFNPDLVTSTATSYSAIIQMNFNLQDLKILNPEFVTNLFIFADVIEVFPGTPIRLPGQISIHIICRKFISHSGADEVPAIMIAANNVDLVASNFIGVLRKENDKTMKHFTIANGTMFETVADTNIANLLTVRSTDISKLPTPSALPELYSQDTSNYYNVWLTRNFINALQLEMVSIQSILSIRANEETVNEGESALLWIIEVLSNRNVDQLSLELETVLGQALLINTTRQPEYVKATLLVPRLTYSQYKNLYEEMLSLIRAYENQLTQVSAEISRRKQAEIDANTQMELNENILSIGKFLVGQVQVATAHQQDIVNYHDSIDSMKRDQILLAEDEAKDLLDQLEEQQKQVKDAGDTLRAALEQYQREQIIRDLFEIAGAVGSLFSGGLGLRTLPATAANIERVAKKVEYVVEVIKLISGLYEQGRNIRNDIGTFNRAATFLDRDFTSISESDFPSELEWMDFDTDIESFTHPSILPGQVSGEASDFRSATKKLSARGRAYLNLQKNLQSLKYDVIVNELQKGVVERHAVRLNELESTLLQSSLTDYEANTTDLFEVGNIVMMRANEVRTNLAQTFVTMDAALQYEYLQPPTPLESYNTLNIQEAVLNQVSRSVTALEDPLFRPHNLPDPVSYDIPAVPVSSLMSDEGFKQRIPLSSIEFFDYVRVRIIEIEMQVDGVEMARDDTVFIEAEASGELIQDRDFRREEKNFVSFPVKYRYMYDFKTGETKVGNRLAPSFIDRFMMMTPFVEWTFRIPNATLNHDIRFAGLVTTLRLKFHVSIILEPAARLQSAGASVTTLLLSMDRREILRDWDAICAMDAEKVNDLWEQKFNYEANNGGFITNVVTQPELFSVVPIGPQMSIQQYTVLNATIGPPRLSFIRHNSNAVNMMMQLKTATLQTQVYSCNTFSGSESCVSTYNFTSSPNIGTDTRIFALLSLTTIVGAVTTQMDVTLDFSNSVTEQEIQGLTIDESIGVRNALTNYFRGIFITQAYVLGTVDFASLNTPYALQPDKFYLATGGFNDSPTGLGTLYIFIKTKSTRSIANEQSTRDFGGSLSRDDYLLPTDYTSALFIASRILFQDLFQPQFAQQLPQFPVVAEKDNTGGTENPAWVLKGTNNGALPFDFTTPSNWVFRLPVSGFQMRGTASGLNINWVSNFRSDVRYRIIDCPAIFFIFCSSNTKEVTNDLGFHIEARGTFNPTINANSVIMFPNIQFAGTLTYTDDTSTFGDFLDGELGRTGFTELLIKQVNGDLSSLSFQAADISVFALTNLIFPGAKVIDLQEVYMPGDMLLLGNIEGTYNPNYKP